MLQRVIYIVNECFMRSYSYKNFVFFVRLFFEYIFTSCQVKKKKNLRALQYRISTQKYHLTDLKMRFMRLCWKFRHKIWIWCWIRLQEHNKIIKTASSSVWESHSMLLYFVLNSIIFIAIAYNKKNVVEFELMLFEQNHQKECNLVEITSSLLF